MSTGKRIQSVRAGRLPVAATFLTLLLPFAGCHRDEMEGGPPPMGVKIVSVSIAEIRETSEYLATLKSRRSIVLQPQIDGQVTQILVAAGDRVQAGQPIIQIDPARQAAVVTSEESNRVAKLASLSCWKPISRCRSSGRATCGWI